MTETNKSDVRTEIIVNFVSEYFGLSPIKVFSYNREENIKKTRQIIQYLIKNNTHKSLDEVGKVSLKYNRQRQHNHASILNSVKKVENHIKTDKNYASVFYDIEKQVKRKIGNILDSDLRKYNAQELTEHFENLLKEKELELHSYEQKYLTQNSNILKNIKNPTLKRLLSLDTETIDFVCETRLKPFLKMHESKVTNNDLIKKQYETRRM